MGNQEDLELLIDDYLDGRLDERRRALFEREMSSDQSFRRRVQSATQSMELLQRALTSVAPGSDFEAKVTSQIISITQSNQNLRPMTARRNEGPLTARDPDARLLADPDAQRERRRLMLLAAVATLVFSLAALAIAWSFIRSEGDRTPPGSGSTGAAPGRR